MSKENKITKNELENLQQLVSKLNSASNQLGNIEMQKHQLLHASQALQNDLQAMQKSLEETYGVININIKDGTYVEVPQAEIDPELKLEE
tara:strand:+ start:433 stop:702 length:270 start_codon:yes stop_codon:yes gene_type:complete